MLGQVNPMRPGKEFSSDILVPSSSADHKESKEEDGGTESHDDDHV